MLNPDVLMCTYGSPKYASIAVDTNKAAWGKLSCLQTLQVDAYASNHEVAVLAAHDEAPQEMLNNVRRSQAALTKLCTTLAWAGT